jgi:hypothetical protein
MINTNPTANATLRFYRLIIFVDIIHLLQLDSRDVDLRQCNNLADIICRHLHDEAVLTAYLTARFGSRYEVGLGLVGAGYAASQSGALPYFTRVLTYISGSLPGLGPVYTYAVTIVEATMDIFGLSASFCGIINWGLLLFGFHSMYKNFRAPPNIDIVEAGLPRPLAMLYRFVLKPLLINSVTTAYQAFSQLPGGIKGLLTAAKRYRESGARVVLQHACSAITPTLTKLIVSTEINPSVFIQLGENFEGIITDIITEFKTKYPETAGTAERLKCRFMTQFANEEGAANLLAALKVQVDTACTASSGAAARVVTNLPTSASQAVLSAPGAVAQQYQQLPPPQLAFPPPQTTFSPPQTTYQLAPDLMHPERSKLLQTTMGYMPASGSSGYRADPYHDGRNRKGRDESKDDGRGRDRRRGGGSSKHKKKHPRSTNKRKLLVKRVRRRRTTMKNKKR